MSDLQREDLIINMDVLIFFLTLSDILWIRESSEIQGEAAREGGDKKKERGQLEDNMKHATTTKSEIALFENLIFRMVVHILMLFTWK